MDFIYLLIALHCSIPAVISMEQVCVHQPTCEEKGCQQPILDATGCPMSDCPCNVVPPVNPFPESCENRDACNIFLVFCNQTFQTDEAGCPKEGCPCGHLIAPPQLPNCPVPEGECRKDCGENNWRTNKEGCATCGCFSDCPAEIGRCSEADCIKLEQDPGYRLINDITNCPCTCPESVVALLIGGSNSTLVEVSKLPTAQTTEPTTRTIEVSSPSPDPTTKPTSTLTEVSSPTQTPTTKPATTATEEILPVPASTIQVNSIQTSEITNVPAPTPLVVEIPRDNTVVEETTPLVVEIPSVNIGVEETTAPVPQPVTQLRQCPAAIRLFTNFRLCRTCDDEYDCRPYQTCCFVMRQGRRLKKGRCVHKVFFELYYTPK